MQEIKVYAPIVIPTLCRYDHFRRCVESLSKCIHADKTELVIGLDYPLKENHWEGYRKINEYVDTITGFKKVTILRTDHNLGFGPQGNMSRLTAYVTEKYDRWISTEDDNEFSPCFLDFINKALEYYKDAPNVSSVCGFNQYCSDKRKVIFTYDTSAWGRGRWVGKKGPTKEDTRTSLNNVWNVLKIFFYYPVALSKMIDMMNLGKSWGDVNWTCRNIVKEQYQLRPSVSLVRNWGCDGSGLHSNVTDVFSNMVISKAALFEMPMEKPKRSKELDVMVRHNMMPAGFFDFIKLELSILYKALLYFFNQRKKQ